MFTGLTTDIGHVSAVRHEADSTTLTVDSGYSGIEEGASVLHSGICLTATRPRRGSRGQRWDAALSRHTRSTTNASGWRTGADLNLERSVRVGDELGGHLVYGHVDTVAELLSVTGEGDSRRLRIAVPDGLEDLMVSRGSVALDGVSLTVAEVDVRRRWFEVVLIAHTLSVTTLRGVKPGYSFNIEADMIARHVVAAVQRMQTG